ncbi:putative DNA modification/repair radical SAM protein [candidate division KSB1 bacterium]|nr:putative DNA modification/repair radical SAM protein [candidate division KSB1 bacterium]RQW01458.1 MAG: putative DNA modification/repair radical SAM protein [candidate division KSB1 bacterium]
MNIFEKLKILAASAKYDVSCASSGSNRINAPGGIGNASYSGICHSYAADGRCISLLKILMTNICIYDCAYCLNRRSNDTPRTIFTPQEIADLTINFYRRNYIEGLFLSSGVVRNPDYTMELMIRTLALLRCSYRFNGYIHSKIVPGTAPELLQHVGRLADRVSVNIELPSQQSLRLLAPEKNKHAIISPMQKIAKTIEENCADRQHYRSTPTFAPAGQSTQLIVSATPETDYTIMQLSEHLYQKMKLRRVYYSAYVPVNYDPKLPNISKPELWREHRLYQADWLIRLYGYRTVEILSAQQPNLNRHVDPKVNWALQHVDFFPIEINTADYEDLLRIPGVGLISAKRIITQRRIQRVGYADLKKIGVALKRARHFITINGKMHSPLRLQPNKLAHALSDYGDEPHQLEFDFTGVRQP